MPDHEQDSPWEDSAFEQAVRETAYHLWESDGRPEGREQDYWFKALEQKLAERNGDQVGSTPQDPSPDQQLDNIDSLGSKVSDVGGSSPDQSSSRK